MAKLNWCESISAGTVITLWVALNAFVIQQLSQSPASPQAEHAKDSFLRVWVMINLPTIAVLAYVTKLTLNECLNNCKPAAEQANDTQLSAQNPSVNIYDDDSGLATRSYRTIS